MLLQCKCGYVWDYQGKSQYATCPRCLHKISVEKHQLINEQEIDSWLIQKLREAEQKLPEDYKPKIRWAIEVLCTSAPAMQKVSARMFALSVIKNL